MFSLCVRAVVTDSKTVDPCMKEKYNVREKFAAVLHGLTAGSAVY